MKTPEEIKRELDQIVYRFSGWLEGETCEDALSYIRQLEERIDKRDDYIHKLEDNQLKWISIRERLPQDGQKIIMINSKYPSITLQGIYQADKTPDTIRVLGFGIGRVTHWMPTPEPPKEG